MRSLEQTDQSVAMLVPISCSVDVELDYFRLRMSL